MPRTFTDDHNTQRELRVTVATMRRARDELGVDIAEVYTGDLAARLTHDPVLLVDLLYLVLGSEEDPVAFAESIVESIGDAARALFLALADFFDPLTSGSASRLVGATLETIERAHALASARATPPSDEQLDQLIDRLLEALTSGVSSTAPPPSSASTPTPSPSASSPSCPRSGSDPRGIAPPPPSPTC